MSIASSHSRRFNVSSADNRLGLESISNLVFHFHTPIWKRGPLWRMVAEGLNPVIFPRAPNKLESDEMSPSVLPAMSRICQGAHSARSISATQRCNTVSGRVVKKTKEHGNKFGALASRGPGRGDARGEGIGDESECSTSKLLDTSFHEWSNCRHVDTSVFKTSTFNCEN